MSEIKRPVILHLTSLEYGGAGMFTINFHHSILKMGYDSYVAVQGRKMIYPDGSVHPIQKKKSHWWNKLKRFIFRQIVKHAYIDNAYSMYNLCERFTCHSATDTLAAMPLKPDVVFVHWVSDYANAEFIAELKNLTGAEMVFIRVDHALFSGGCHYQIDCQGYQDGCHDCPATTSSIVKKGIEENYTFKKKYLPQSTIFVSKADKLRLIQSEIYCTFRFEEFVFPIDANKFCPAENRNALRKKWNLPIDKKIVFFGATSLDERRKGMKELIDALPEVQTKDVVYMAAGNVKSFSFPDNTIAMGYLSEAQLIQMYQIADVFVCPSLADTGPMMVKQSLICGTPVVAFPVGVSVEMVKAELTGYLARYGDSADLAKGIDTILSLSSKEWQQMSDNCRKLAVDTYANPQKQSVLKDFIEKIAS